MTIFGIIIVIQNPVVLQVLIITNILLDSCQISDTLTVKKLYVSKHHQKPYLYAHFRPRLHSRGQVEQSKCSGFNFPYWFPFLFALMPMIETSTKTFMINIALFDCRLHVLKLKFGLRVAIHLHLLLLLQRASSSSPPQRGFFLSVSVMYNSIHVNDPLV